MTGTLLTAANWPIVGQIAWLLGKFMNFIYTTLDKLLGDFDTGLVGLSIIIFTIFVYTCLLPLTIKQQRSSRMMSVINPEIQAIQKKYKNKKDQASMMKQQEEVQQVYDKYGTSMVGGCLPMLIQMPFLFGLYPVVSAISKYVPAVSEASAKVNQFITIPDLTISPIQMIKESGKFDFPSVVIIITAVALPLLSGLTQFFSIKLTQAVSGQQIDEDNPMAGTMKSMNMMMPIFSVFMVFTLPAGLGLYWIISAVVRSVQQLFVNKHLEKISIDDMIERNREKAEKKMRKRGEKAEKINNMAQMSTRNIKKSQVSEKEKQELLKKAEEKRNQAKEGSLSSKANLVKKFNENN